MTTIQRCCISVLVAAGACLPVGIACAQGNRPIGRAPLPTWDRLPPGVFFDDAFRDGLRGERPPSLGVASQPDPQRLSTVDEAVNLEPNTAAFTWSSVVSAGTIEDEIKSIERQLRAATKTEGQFKTQGYRDVRTALGTAAALFAVIQHYDQPVRWQQDADSHSHRLARAAANARVGTAQVFREVRQRQQELFDMIRGSRISVDPVDELQWASVADRSILMKRLAQSIQTSLGESMASSTRFASQADTARHEAELISAVAQMLTQPGMDDADDAEYQTLSKLLSSTADAMVQAAAKQDYARARSTFATLKKSCDDCHESYRG